MSRSVRIVVLCEDVQHEAFIRRFMKKMGWNTRDLRIEKASSGRGSAEQFVRNRFPTELQTLRSKGGEQAYLIVMVDGDDRGVASRKASLATSCGETGIAPPGNADHVLICVPTWNVETWISYLGGATVDERRADYPRLSRPRDCMPNGRRTRGDVPPRSPAHAVPAFPRRHMRPVPAALRMRRSRRRTKR